STTATSPLSLHDALPIFLQPIIVSPISPDLVDLEGARSVGAAGVDAVGADGAGALQVDDRFRLISGERRYTAARDLKLATVPARSEEHTSELQSRGHLVC